MVEVGDVRDFSDLRNQERRGRGFDEALWSDVLSWGNISEVEKVDYDEALATARYACESNWCHRGIE
jgi:hypothetical protein